MKDYQRVIIWMDYFNRALPRSGGRRLPRGSCVQDITITNLAEAAQRAGYTVHQTNHDARYPRRPHIRSGYISINKTSSKTRTLVRIASKLRQASKKR